MNRKIIAVIICLVTLIACSREAVKRFQGFDKPEGFPEPVYRFSDNKITEAGFTLGRKLFYEPRLSRNNTISCGSCHIQSSAFTQHGHDVSHGIDDRLGTRNSPPIMNLAWMNSFFWDGGVFDLDLQPVVPITNHVEMDESIENVIRKLRAVPAYPTLFRNAFGDTAITTARLMKSLSQFMLLCISTNSRYDSVMRAQASFTPKEQQGYVIFKQQCNGCHKEPLFTDFSFRNNGIGKGLNDDTGRYMVTLDEKDKYRFKVPSLRNIGYTSPFMHDGRFITLSAVIDHYRNMGGSSEADPLLSGSIPLSNDEKDQLLAFLSTLNDKAFITNKLLSEQ